MDKSDREAMIEAATRVLLGNEPLAEAVVRAFLAEAERRGYKLVGGGGDAGVVSQFEILAP